jgi:uncharacterized protein YndB with AHSA1/START domain
MTRQKSFKRHVRQRMTLTGEKYTVARQQLIARPRSAPVVPPPAMKGYRVTDQTLRTRTGRTWDEWFAALDAVGAARRAHREVWRGLVRDFELEGRWAQVISIGYERARGIRAPHQRHDGLFAAASSKTFAVPVNRLYQAFADDRVRRGWLPAGRLRVRKAEPGKLLAAAWRDGPSLVMISFVPRTVAKSQVIVDHRRLPSVQAVGEMKAFWKARLAALAEKLQAAERHPRGGNHP